MRGYGVPPLRVAKDDNATGAVKNLLKNGHETGVLVAFLTYLRVAREGEETGGNGRGGGKVVEVGGGGGEWVRWGGGGGVINSHQ